MRISLQEHRSKLVRVGNNHGEGLGACLGLCPEGAISIIERDVPPFDEKAIQMQSKEQLLKSIGSTLSSQHSDISFSNIPDIAPALTHWPIT